MIEYDAKDGSGINWFVAGLFIVAQLAGGGIVALPTAVIQSGPNYYSFQILFLKRSLDWHVFECFTDR